MSAENQSNDKIQSLKDQISMFQRENESLKKEAEKVEEIKRNLLQQQQQQQEDEILEKSTEEVEAAHFSPLHSSYLNGQFIIEDGDPFIGDDIGEEEYFNDPRNVALKEAEERIEALENQIYRLRKTAKEDDDYIVRLEREREKYESPKRRIQFLENQLESGRHQYANLNEQLRRREESEREKAAAYESMKNNFLSHLIRMNNENDELAFNLEAKNKENQELRQIIAKFQASYNLASPSTSEIASVANTQTTDDSMDISNPQIHAVANANVLPSPKKSNGSSPDLCF